MQDNNTSCNVTPCLPGQTCNPDTGLCEGTPLMDMSVVQQTPPFDPQRDLFATTAQSQFNLAVADLEGDNSLEIVLSDNSNTFNIFSSTDHYKTVNMTPDQVKLDLTQAISSLSGYYNPTSQTKDLLVVTLGSTLFYYNNQSGRPVQASSTTVFQNTDLGFKLITIGYANTDNVPDVIITSTQLALIGQVLGVNPASGNAAILTGPLVSTKPTVTATITNGGLSMAAPALHSFGSGFTIAESKPDGNSVKLEQLNSSNSLMTINSADQLPTTDFAIPVDLNLDGKLDLVLGKTFNTTGTMAGQLNVMINGNDNNMPSYQNPQSLAATDLINLAVDDYDSDGYYDIIVSLYLTKKVIVYHNNRAQPGNFNLSLEVDGKYGARSALFADMDGDGCKDLVALFGGDMNGPGTEVVLVHGHTSFGSPGALLTCP